MLTFKEYADKNGISVREVYRMAEKGKIEVVQEPKTVIKRMVNFVVGS